MAYGRRSTVRRKGRRGNRSLSTRRIFGNKSARSQAKQIYALRRSISRVKAQCRPEVKELDSDYDNRPLRNSDVSSSTANYYRLDPPLPELGTADNQRVGNNIKIYPLKFRMTLQYREDYESQQYPAFAELPTHGMQVRIFAIQAKAAEASAPPLGDLLQTVNFDEFLDSSAMMVQPFRTGITAKYNVLYNRVFTVSKDKPMIARTIKIVPKIKHIRWQDSTLQPRGKIYLFVFQGGAVYRRTIADPDDLYDYNETNLMFRFSQPYTDA